MKCKRHFFSSKELREKLDDVELERLFNEALAIFSLLPMVAHFDGNWTRAKLNEIIHGKRGISLEIALDLADALGTSPEFWINLQINHDLWKTMQHYKKIQRIDFTPRDSEEPDCL